MTPAATQPTNGPPRRHPSAQTPATAGVTDHAVIMSSKSAANRGPTPSDECSAASSNRWAAMVCAATR